MLSGVLYCSRIHRHTKQNLSRYINTRHWKEYWTNAEQLQHFTMTWQPRMIYNPLNSRFFYLQLEQFNLFIEQITATPHNILIWDIYKLKKNILILCIFLLDFLFYSQVLKNLLFFKLGQNISQFDSNCKRCSKRIVEFLSKLSPFGNFPLEPILALQGRKTRKLCFSPQYNKIRDFQLQEVIIY